MRCSPPPHPTNGYTIHQHCSPSPRPHAPQSNSKPSIPTRSPSRPHRRISSISSSHLRQTTTPQTAALPYGSGRPRLPRCQLEKTSAARSSPSPLLSSRLLFLFSPLAPRCCPIPGRVPHVCGLPSVPRVVTRNLAPQGGTLAKGGCYMPLAPTPTPSASPVSHAVQLPDSPGTPNGAA